MGQEFYASMSFSDLPDNRRIMLAWMTNWDYPFSFPTSGWKGQLTIPRELSLRTTNEGIRLHQSPISELETLRDTVIHVNNRQVTETSENVLKGFRPVRLKSRPKSRFRQTAASWNSASGCGKAADNRRWSVTIMPRIISSLTARHREPRISPACSRLNTKLCFTP